ncbi:hypothetical protein Tco_1416698, partial [Tanacetum coccineum]
MALPPRAKRHLLLRFDAQDYTNVLDFDVLTDEMDQTMTDRLRMEHTGADGQVVFTSHAWRQLFGIRGPLVRELILEFFRTCRFADSVLDLDTADTFQFQSDVPSYTLIKDPLRRLCHRLIAFSIAGRGMLQGGSGVLGCLEVAMGPERHQVRATAGAAHGFLQLVLQLVSIVSGGFRGLFCCYKPIGIGSLEAFVLVILG